MILRDYQIDCRRSVLEAFKESNSVLIVLPTGCGKTVVFSDIARCMFPRRTMVIAHRQELIWQAQEKIARVTGWKVDVEMGDYKSSQAPDFFNQTRAVVSTVQTHVAGGDGGGRMGKFDPEKFGFLVIDEAHHATSPSYQKIFNYYRSNPRLKVLGVTATPDRTDEEALGQIFETVAFDYEILNAINDGWLVPIYQQLVNVEGLDFSSVRITAGDLNGADLAAVMEAEKALQGIAHPTIEIIKDKRTLVFAASVQHAKSLSDIFNRHRPGCSNWVCGKTDKDERRVINANFNAGKLQILCNCGTHTEGFDSPGVEVIIMARPTKSRSLYAQMVGRSTRPLPGIVDFAEDLSQLFNTPVIRKQRISESAKPSCLIVDFVGNSGRHKLMTSADILGGNVSDVAIDRALQRARTGKPVRMDRALDEEEQAEQAEQRRLQEAARKAKFVAKAKYSTQEVDPFDVLQVKPVKARGWDAGRQLTEKQRNFLRRNGINPDKVPFAQAKQLIGEMCNRFEKKLCTLGQAKLLKRFGYSTDLTFDIASKLIDAVAKNCWQPVPIEKFIPSQTVEDDVPF